MPRHNSEPVTLPAAAAQAAHEFDEDTFVFSPNNEHGPPSDIAPMEDLPEGARVPGEIPPADVLPEAAEINMSETAMDKPEANGVPWWLDDLDM